jgi:hypothetical protein
MDVQSHAELPAPLTPHVSAEALIVISYQFDLAPTPDSAFRVQQEGAVTAWFSRKCFLDRWRCVLPG